MLHGDPNGDLLDRRDLGDLHPANSYPRLQGKRGHEWLQGFAG
jgi:hypothetical protein